jgi:hypothetical protein
VRSLAAVRFASTKHAGSLCSGVAVAVAVVAVVVRHAE